MSGKNQNLNLLLVVKEVENFDSQVTFLRRRGWKVEIVDTLRDGIEYIIGNQPDFVLISVNHPNPKVIKMPTIISQTFNCRSILIGEYLDSQTAAALTKSGARDVIHAPVSGPGIQLRVKQILAREDQELSDAQKGPKAQPAAPAGKRKPSVMVTSAPESKTRAPSVAEQIAARNKSAGSPSGGRPHQVVMPPASGSAGGRQKGISYMPQQQTGGGHFAGTPRGSSSTSPTDASSPAHQRKNMMESSPFAEAPIVEAAAEDFDFTAAASDLSTALPEIPEHEAPPVSESEESQDKQKGFDPLSMVDMKPSDLPAHYNPQTGESTATNKSGAAYVPPPSEPSQPTAHHPEVPDAPSSQGPVTHGRPESASKQNSQEHPDAESPSGSQSGSSFPDYQAPEKSGSPESNQGATDNQQGPGPETTAQEASPSEESSSSQSAGEAGYPAAAAPVDQVERNPDLDSEGQQKETSSEKKDTPSVSADADDTKSETVKPAVASLEPSDLKAKGYKPAFKSSDDFSGTDMVTFMRIIRESFEDCANPVKEASVKNQDLFYDAYVVNVQGTTGVLLYSSLSKGVLESHLIPKINTRILEGLENAGFVMDKMQNVDAKKLFDLEISDVFSASSMSLISDEQSTVLTLSYMEMKSDFIEDKEKNMVGFPISYIPTDVKSPFKVFLYLPVNKKYYLYLNDGSCFSEKQMEKLESKGITHLHISNSDRSKMDKFFMEKRLVANFKKSS